MDLTKMQKDCIPNPSRVHLWSFFGHMKVACISCSKLGLDLWKLLRERSKMETTFTKIMKRVRPGCVRTPSVWD